MKYAIRAGKRYWGPFATAEAAAKWGLKSLSCPYVIIMLERPGK